MKSWSATRPTTKRSRLSRSPTIHAADGIGRPKSHESCDKLCLICDFARRLPHRRRLLILIDDLV